MVLINSSIVFSRINQFRSFNSDGVVLGFTHCLTPFRESRVTTYNLPTAEWHPPSYFADMLIHPSVSCYIGFSIDTGDRQPWRV